MIFSPVEAPATGQYDSYAAEVDPAGGRFFGNKSPFVLEVQRGADLVIDLDQNNLSKLARCRPSKGPIVVPSVGRSVTSAVAYATGRASADAR
jgi:hypothetical protein